MGHIASCLVLTTGKCADKHVFTKLFIPIIAFADQTNDEGRSFVYSTRPSDFEINFNSGLASEGETPLRMYPKALSGNSDV